MKKIIIFLSILILLVTTNSFAMPEDEVRKYIGKEVYVGVFLSSKTPLPVSAIRRYKGEVVAIRKGTNDLYYLVLFGTQLFVDDIMIECKKIAYIKEIKRR